MTPLRLQPIPYQGSKRALAPKICRLFPRGVRTLFEPFAGSAAVSIYAANFDLAQRFVIGDAHSELIDLWRSLVGNPGDLSHRYRALWEQQFAAGAGHHFNKIRSSFNSSRDPAMLLYLIARCVKNAVRFNRRGEFTQSVDKRRTGVHPDKLEQTIAQVSRLLAGRTEFFAGDFRECIASATPADLVYLDPPYHGTTYGRDKRYASQLERDDLISGLAELNERQVPFVLSYDGKTGERSYAEPLPDSLRLVHLYIHAGRSSQSTLVGRDEHTLESLYISRDVAAGLEALPNYERPESLQDSFPFQGVLDQETQIQTG